MGYTPLEGVMMGTRSGDVDPSVLETIMNNTGMTIKDAINYLNKKSGLLGISGVSGDMRDVEDAIKAGNERAKLALDMYEYRIIKYVGSYIAAMNGVDAIAFTAGIGENTSFVREKILAYLGYLGIEINLEENKKRGEDAIISTKESKVPVCIIPTNEELAICRETVALVK